MLRKEVREGNQRQEKGQNESKGGRDKARIGREEQEQREEKKGGGKRKGKGGKEERKENNFAKRRTSEQKGINIKPLLRHTHKKSNQNST